MGHTGHHAWVVSAMAEGTDFKDRIISVLDPVAKRSGLERRQLIAVIALAALLILPLSALHPSIRAAVASESASRGGVPSDRPGQADSGGARNTEDERARGAGSASDRQSDAFIALLDNPEADVREHAAEALGRSRNPRAVPALIEALGDRNRSVREHVASALGETGDRRAILPLIEAVRSDADARVREHAASALGRIGEDPDSYRMLVDTYNSDPDASVRAHAAYGLGLMRAQAAFDLLVDGLLSTHAVIRLHCADALGFLGDPRAVSHLEEALEDADSGVREAAARALRRIHRNL